MSIENELINLPLDRFLDKLSDRVPTPGGGAVAGVCGALACNLARMVAVYRIGPKTPQEQKDMVQDILVHLSRADEMLRSLVDEDARAYAAYSQFTTTKDDSEESAKQLDTIIAVAMAVPMQMCATACETLRLMEQLVPLAGKWLLSDLDAAAILAEATVRCAGCMVMVNAANVRNSAEADEAVSTLQQLEKNSQTLLSTIRSAIKARIQSAT